MTTVTSPPPPKVFTPILKVFLLAMILANLGGQLFFPLQVLYLKELGAGVEQIGLFFTLSMIVPILMQILGGWVSDHVGRLQAIAIGSVIGTVSWVGMLLAPTWQWLLAAEALGAITAAFVAPSFDAFIAEQSDEANRGKVFASVQTFYQSVLVAGPLLGGLMAQGLGWRTVMWTAALMYFAATAIRVVLSRAHPKHRAPDAEPHPSFLASFKTIGAMALGGGLVTWLIISDGARDIAMGFSGNLIPLFLKELRDIDTAGVGLLQSLMGVATALIMLPAGHFSDRHGERKAIALGYLGAFLSFMVFIFVPGKIAASASFVAFGLSVGMLMPAYQSLISKAFPEKLRGMAFGLLSTSNGIVALPSPWLGGLMWTAWGPRVPFLITSVVMLLVIIPVWTKFKLAENRDQLTSA